MGFRPEHVKGVMLVSWEFRNKAMQTEGLTQQFWRPEVRPRGHGAKILLKVLGDNLFQSFLLASGSPRLDTAFTSYVCVPEFSLLIGTPVMLTYGSALLQYNLILT